MKGLFVTLLAVFKMAFSRVSSKTSRYFVKEMYAGEDLERLVATIIACIAADVESKVIFVRDIPYNVGDYEFPRSVSELIGAYPIYGYRNSALKVGPLKALPRVSNFLEVSLPESTKDGSNEVEKHYDLMSPVEVSDFFRRANENEPEELKWEMTVPEKSWRTYSDFKGFITASNGGSFQLLRNDVGTVSEEVSTILNVKEPYGIQGKWDYDLALEEVAIWFRSVKTGTRG